MTDSAIKGDGTSRYLKGPADAAAKYPTFEAFREAWVKGTLTTDLSGINPAGWNVQGTPLNKANLLTDALCTALGLATTATPTQAMDKLRQLVATAQNGVDNGLKIATGMYLGTGKSGPTYQNTLTFPFTPKLVVIKNNYINGQNLLAEYARVQFGILVNPSKSGASIHGSSINNGFAGLYVTWGNNSVSWYYVQYGETANTYLGNEQLNGAENGNPFDYYYVAIG